MPAKFRVCNAAGASVGTAGVVTAFGLIGTAASTDPFIDETIASTTPDTQFRWDATAQQWIFNISTKGYQNGRTYYYRIDLNDGSSIYFQFRTK